MAPKQVEKEIMLRVAVSLEQFSDREGNPKSSHSPNKVCRCFSQSIEATETSLLTSIARIKLSWLVEGKIES